MGRGRHAPTPEQRKTVEAASGWGVPLETIADHLGITYITLRRRYREEIARGRALAHLRVAKTMFEMAVESRDVGALRWWTACQMKWSPAPTQVELYSGPGKALIIKDDREDSLAAYFRSQEATARASLPRPGNGVEHDRPEGEAPPGDAGPRTS